MLNIFFVLNICVEDFYRLNSFNVSSELRRIGRLLALWLMKINPIYRVIVTFTCLKLAIVLGR